jgi:hypothetical protein
LTSRNGQEVKRTVEQANELSSAAAQMTMEKCSAEEFEPGEYTVQIKVTDNLTKEIIASSQKFAVR